jgi:hypothetical protein
MIRKTANIRDDLNIQVFDVKKQSLSPEIRY